LAGMRLKAQDFSALALLGLVRLVIPPLVLWPVLTWIGADGVMRDVLLAQAAMPVAVTAVAFTSEFDARPDLVGASVITTTLASLVTVTILLELLGAA
ncbi:MAG TPA: AEC family transporter, partial [Limnochordia bacterium]|nr:AEC family transporter [Limnochordia bacterium]